LTRKKPKAPLGVCSYQSAKHRGGKKKNKKKTPTGKKSIGLLQTNPGGDSGVIKKGEFQKEKKKKMGQKFVTEIKVNKGYWQQRKSSMETFQQGTDPLQWGGGRPSQSQTKTQHPWGERETKGAQAPGKHRRGGRGKKGRKEG